MKSQGDLLIDRRLSPSGDLVILECCRRAKEHEAAGEYEAARNTLAELGRWGGAGHSPVLEGLSKGASAAFLLRAGALTGWLGSAQQMAGAQEAAKDLISEGMRSFEALGDKSGAAEARTELALCYWREGAFDEGRVTLREALDLLDDSDNEMRARALLRWVTIERSDGRLQAALEMLCGNDELFGSLDDHYLQGCFFNLRGLTYKDLLESGSVGDYADRALVDYSAASYHFEQAGHTRYQGRVENNLGYLRLVMGCLNEAHEHLNYARGLFVGLKDRGGVIQADETRARVFIAEGRYDKAVEITRPIITTLEQGEEHALLAEVLTTAGIALARMRCPDEAKAHLHRAVEIAEAAGALGRAALAALTLIEEMHGHLSPLEVCEAYETADRVAGADAITATLLRMRDCASLLPDMVRRLLTVHLPCDLDTEVSSLERQYIEAALNVSDGRITKAARLLGFKHPQSLNSIMQSRHPDLMNTRRPPVKRHRRLMKPRPK
jgi:tetratricopeptide (TPR) repeat protein